MDKKQVTAAVGYINENAEWLHAPDADEKARAKVDVGPPITEDNVIKANVRGDNAVLLIDRGIKGTPKYILSVKVIESYAATKTTTKSTSKSKSSSRKSSNK